MGEGFSTGGPFGKAKEYFKVLAEARYRDVCKKSTCDGDNVLLVKLCAFLFLDIVCNTTIFEDVGPFPFSHMDMGTQYNCRR